MSNSNRTILPFDRFAPDRATLDAAWEVFRAIRKLRNTDELVERLLAKVLEGIPAKRGTVLLPDVRSAFEINADLVAVARREHAAIWENAPVSVLCAPLRVFDSDFGAIYLDNPRPNAFHTRDLQLLATIAAHAAVKLDHTRDFESVQAENQRLVKDAYGGAELIGQSEFAKKLRELVKKLAPSKSTVLILGPTGTGKELVAFGLHHRSGRTGQFVAINCSTLRGDMVESTLFGHEKGAFTGAAALKIGLVELANGGTLFLDEIGELPLEIQAILLRFLESQEFRRVGGTETRKANTRIIAATNRNLEEWVEQGKFRADLFYRLQTFQLYTSPLCEIAEDIPMLVAHFIHNLSYKRERGRVTGIADEALKLLVEYPWPGNIRQLQTTIDRAIQVGHTEILQVEDVIDSLRPVKNQNRAAGYYASLKHHERTLILNALAAAGGKIVKAADILGISDSYLRRRIKDLDIQMP
jgi:transcriptional regulator with GAF, ATPase, and Fis domain